MSYSLNSFKRGYIGDSIGSMIRVIKGDTRSLDSGSIVLRNLRVWGRGFAITTCA